ncbi:hypothetical protein ERX46_09295 [Brumimicrobium glaciale]|uniref:DUF4843 domain-containing protein n=1 Tax=Brumimicrobium glaciale TaxID=200475 RepID=A0A4Q4KNW6_9FLAO|nr:hypothetical protein [Brumimicrobium glaciale]RYM34144.1 hypothetical protein ERX46_09295 [Brumimicrobium glaciale]
MLKKIFIRLIILATMLVVFNFIYAKWFYENDLKKHAKIINLVSVIPNNADIIYIGESSNITYREDDLDKRAISEFVGDFYQELKLYDITKPASHAGVYKKLLELIPQENHVESIVVTLNLRSFNAQWINSDLEAALQKSFVLIQSYPPLFNRFMLSFKNYDNRSETMRSDDIHKKWSKDKFIMPDNFQFRNVIEWDYWMANNDMYDKVKSDLACHYIKTYGFQIDFENNPRIKDFNAIVTLAKERNWNLVFNLLAENTQKADDLVGEDLIFMMNQNAEKLINYYEDKGVTVINNLNNVDDEQFIDQDWTTEHYAEKGRKIVAKNVAEGLKKWHRKDFKSVE